MVAIVAGNGLGLERSSAKVLGGDGLLGSAFLGRGNDGVYVNASNGNLVIQNQDEFLIGRGADNAVARSYNSQGSYGTDPDNWLVSTQRKVALSSGTINTAGSVAKRQDWDGSETLFTWDSARNAYVSKEGSGAYDTLTYSGTTWTFTDGNSRITENYDNSGSNGGRLSLTTDADGNQLNYTYSGQLLTKITSSNGDYTSFSYTTGNLTKVSTTYTDLLTNTVKTATRAYYAYDTSNRLIKVTIDMSPENNNTSDGKTYVTNYTYDGTSRRIATISQTDGSNLAIAYDTSGRVTTLTQTVATGVTRVTTIVYDDPNHITTVTDPLGQATAMVYDAAGQLTQVTSPAGQVTSYAYNGNGDLISSTDAAGNTTTYNYDGNGNLLEQRDALGNTTAYSYSSGTNAVLSKTQFLTPDPDAISTGASASDPLTTRFVYDAENHLRFIVSPDGRVVEYRYDGWGQRTAEINYVADLYSAATISESEMNSWATAVPDKSRTIRKDTGYDFRGNVASVTTYGSTDSSGNGMVDGSTAQIFYVYDQFGNLLRRQVDGSSAMETFLYDGLGRRISATDLLGAVTLTSYGDGQPKTTVTLASGLVQTSVYNFAGELVSFTETGTGITTSATTYKYDASGQLRMSTDPTGVRSYFLYDSAERKIADIGDDGSVTEYRYDARNQLIASISYANVLNAGQLASLVDGSGNPTLVSLASLLPTATAQDRWNWRIYDVADRLVQMIDAEGAVVQIDYDGAGRENRTTAFASAMSSSSLAAFKSTLPTTPISATSDSANDRMTRRFYNEDSLVVGELDADGFLTQIIYDNAGQTTQTIRHTNAAVGADGPSTIALRATGTLAQIKAAIITASTDIKEFFLYDAKGNLAAKIDGINGLTRYSYTPLGFLAQETRGQKLSGSTVYTLANLPAPPGGTILETINYTRTLYGDVLTQTRVLAGTGMETTTYSYDSMRQLLSTTVSESISSDTRTSQQTYDLKGRLTGTLSGVGSAALAALGSSPTQTQIDNIYANYGTRYLYDTADRLIAKITPNGDTATGLKTLYYYTADGDLAFEINAQGEVTEYRYNSFRERSQAIQYGTRLTSTTLNSLTGGLATPSISATLQALSNASLDSVTQLSYDNRGALTETTNAVGARTRYSYNRFGETVSVAALVAGTTEALTAYSYDRRGNSVSRTLDAGAGRLNLNSSMSFDAFGNVVDSVDARGTHRTADYNKLGQVKETVDGAGFHSFFTYDALGNALKSTDRNGRDTTFTYDAFNRNITTKTPENVTSTVKNNAFGQVIEIKDGANRTTSYIYDKDGHLKSVTETAASGVTLETTYSYDKAGRLRDVTDARGNVTRYIYDAANRILSRTEDYGSGKLNLTTTYTYDAKGQQIAVSDPAGCITQINYDLGGRKVRIIQDAGAGKLNLTTDYGYRADGKVISMAEAVGTSAARTTSYDYDALGKLTQTRVDPNGINETTNFAYDANGNVAASTDSLGRTTRYVYDQENRQSLKITADGSVTETGYDNEGREIWTRAYANKLAQSTIDGWNSSATWQITSAQAATTIDAIQDRVNRWLYDKDGRQTFSIDPEGYVSENRYDAANNVIKTIRYSIAVSVGDNVDRSILVPLLIGASTVETNYEYDDANRLTAVIDALGVRTEYILSATGQIRYERIAWGTSDQVQTYREYDALGRMTLETKAITEAEAATTRFAYDAAGNLVSIIDPLGYVTTRTYDANHRMLSETVPIDASTGATTTREYDARGNVVKVTDSRGNAGYFYYDSLDRLSLQIDPEGYAIETSYGFGNNVASIKRYALKPSGTGNIAIRPTLATDATDSVTSFTRDKLDRVIATTDAEGFTEAYVLDAFGNRTQITNKLGGVTDNVFDRRGLLISETLPQSSAWIDGISRRIVNSFAYDWRGNLKEKHEAVGLAEERSTYFSYDKLDQLIQINMDKVETIGQNMATLTEARQIEYFVYDRRGNRIATADAGGSITFTYYDHLDRKKSEINPAGTLTTWQYDANSNVISEKMYGDAITSLPSDPTGQVAQIYRLYDVAFGRMPYNSEVTYWLGQMNTVYQNATQPAGETWPAIDAFGEKMNVVEAVASEMLNDPAVILRLGNTTDADFITMMFQYAYRRDPGAGEASTWAANLTGGWTRAGMLALFSENIEHRPVATGLIANDAASRAQPAPINPSNYRERLFAYDRNNQLLATSHAGIRTGAFNGTSYQSSTGTLTEQRVYDAMGNLIREIDANGASIYHYYDKRGREIARVDAENYLTEFTLDADGNVVSERRYATKLTTTPTIGSVPTGATSSDDRVTNFTYDRMGRRTAQFRTGVLNVMDGSNGSITGTPLTSVISYTYNGLGLVTSKTEGNGDSTTYSYDLMGRQVQISEMGFVDFNGNAVQPVMTLSYDGLNNLTRSVENGTRTTTYTYGAGGRLMSVKDASNFKIDYGYDLAGRVVREKYDRARSAGLPGVTDAKFYFYDAEGRIKTQGMVNKSTDWVRADGVETFNYDSYGNLVSKSVGDGVQEQYFYDAAGRVIKTNAGDGLWRFYVYDGAGNATLMLQSNGRDISGETLDSLLSYVGAIDSSTVTDVIATITVFDKRGQQIATREPNRELRYNASNPAIVDKATITHSRTYNAFGDVSSETTGGNQTTNYSYNTLGRLVRIERPTVNVTNENGGVVSLRPTENYFYDLAGRMVGSQDANGYLTRRTLLAGTGHDDPQNALVVSEYRPDGSLWQTAYDAFGDARKLVDGLGRITLQSFDGMGRLTQIIRPQRTNGIQLTESYTYDGLGQRLTHSVVGAGATGTGNGMVTQKTEKTNYDIFGRVVTTITMGDDVTNYSYAWVNGVTNSTVGVWGGWTKTVSYANGHSATETTDYFDRQMSRTDLGGHVYINSYDRAGRVTAQTTSAATNQTHSFTYWNTGRLASETIQTGDPLMANSDWDRTIGTYGYNADGDRVSERLINEGSNYVFDPYYGFGYDLPYSTVRVSSEASYDALGRLTNLTDSAAQGTGPMTLSYEYDAVSNVRHMVATYRQVTASGSLSTGTSVQDYWYRYDALNRFVTTKGVLTGTAGAAGTTISRGYSWTGLGDGRDISYNAAGERATVTFTNGQMEEYGYTADGFLETVRIGSPGATLLRAKTTRNALGRISRYEEYDTSGAIVHSRDDITYDQQGQILYEQTSTKQGSDTFITRNTYTYSIPGVLTSVSSQNFKNGNVVGSQADLDAPDSTQTYTYEWWDSAMLKSEVLVNSNGTATSTYYYDGSGYLKTVAIVGGSRPRTVNFTNDLSGQVMARTEYSSFSANPTQYYYYFDGKQVGSNGNNGTENNDHVTALAERVQASPSSPGPFRQGATTGTSFADFDQSYEAISPSSQTATATTYTVRDGETLTSVAQTIWGDASLWYVLADANGLDYDSGLAAGQLLTLPNRPTNQHNSADTFRPYDPSTAMGDTQPAAPNPPKKKKKCGIFGTILRVVVTVVVAAVVSSFAGPVIGAAAGNAAGQGVAIATGEQSKFSFKQVAIAALTAAVGGDSSAGQGSILDAAVDGAIRNLIVQKIAVATGLQKKFDWTGVAVAAVTSGTARAVNGPSNTQTSSTGNFAVQYALRSSASAVAGAATRSLIDGTDFGDNLVAVLPNVAANVAINVAAYTIASQQTTREQVSILTPDQEAMMYETLEPAGGIEPFSLTAFPGIPSDILSPATANALSAAAPLQSSYQYDEQFDADITVTASSTRPAEWIRPTENIGHYISLVDLIRDWDIYNAQMAARPGAKNDPSVIAGFEAEQKRLMEFDATFAKDDLVFTALTAPTMMAPLAVEGAGFYAIGTIGSRLVGAAMVASAGNHITSDYSAPFRGSSQTIIAQAGNRFRAGLGTGISYGIDAAAIGGGLAVAGRNALNGVTAAETAGGKYGVAFFGESNVGYYTVENATLGRTGGSFFMMPLEDSALVTNAASAARYTGMSPSTLKAYTEGGDIFGISFPTNGMKARAPTAADAGGWPHFLEGGHTAVRLEGPNAGYLVNPTREFVIPGGNAVPNGSVMFKLGPNGEWIPMRKF